MQKNAPPSPIFSRLVANVSKTLKVALPVLATMFAVSTANAGEIVRYNYVDDAVGTADQFQNGGLLKSFFGPAINFGYNTTPDISPFQISGNGRVTIHTTAWDAGAPPQPSILNLDAFTRFGTVTPRPASIFLTRQETEYRFSFANDSGSINSFGLYTPNNLVGTNGSNPYYRGRNFRVILSGIAANTPRDVTCTGVVDGGTYASIPNSLSGTTTPLLAGAVIGVHEVYLSLQRKTDNLYWSGTQWSTAQVNLPTNITLYNSFSPNQSWQIANPLPTLSSGQYAIRVMAVQGLAGSPSPGLLRVVDFTIGNGGTPNPSGTYRIRNRWTNFYISDPYSNGYAYQVNSAASNTEWELINTNGYTRFKNRVTGNFLHIEPNDGYLRAGFAPDYWLSSQWFIREDGTPYKRIESRWMPSKFMNVEAATNTIPNTTIACGLIQNYWFSPQWTFEPVVSVNGISGSSSIKTSSFEKVDSQTSSKIPTDLPPSGGSS